MEILISLLILVVIFAVVWWILSMIPVPEPFVWIVRVVFAIVFLIALVGLLNGNYSVWHGGAGALR